MLSVVYLNMQTKPWAGHGNAVGAMGIRTCTNDIRLLDIV